MTGIVYSSILQTLLSNKKSTLSLIDCSLFFYTQKHLSLLVHRQLLKVTTNSLRTTKQRDNCNVGGYIGKSWNVVEETRGKHAAGSIVVPINIL